MERGTAEQDFKDTAESLGPTLANVAKAKTTSCSVMPSKVYSAAVVGVEAFEVEIEVHAGWGNTDKIAVVGLPDTAVKEARIGSPRRLPIVDCVGYMDKGSPSIWLRPMSEEGPSFDLPIALGMLKLEESNRLPGLDAYCITAELALSWQLRPVKGVLSIALEAKRRRGSCCSGGCGCARAAVSLSEVSQFVRGEIFVEAVRSTM